MAEIYICAGGCPTIGYGHVVRGGERERFTGGIDEAAAEELLRHDFESAERAVLRLIRVPLEDRQFDTLSSSGAAAAFIRSSILPAARPISTSYRWRPLTTGGFDEDFGVLSDFR